MRTAVAMNEAAAGRKGISPAVSLPEGLPRAPCDPGRIGQVLNDLLDNAIESSRPHTEVSVLARREGSSVRIVVEDHGLGIPREELGEIFVRFGKTSTRPTGGERTTGLGLSIGKELIARHGGKIEVESDVGVGSRFSLTLPLLRTARG
jgi:two-component system, response regulator PhcR